MSEYDHGMVSRSGRGGIFQGINGNVQVISRTSKMQYKFLCPVEPALRPRSLVSLTKTHPTHLSSYPIFPPSSSPSKVYGGLRALDTDEKPLNRKSEFETKSMSSSKNLERRTKKPSMYKTLTLLLG